MSIVNNSPLLEVLIEYAKNIGDKKALLTAERFVVAICDYLHGDITAENSEESKMKLSEFFRLNRVYPENIKAVLLDYINYCNPETFLSEGGYYIQRKMYEARAAAAKEGRSELAPEDLLLSILNAPTPVIKSAFNTNNAAEPQKEEPQPVEPKKDGKKCGENLADTEIVKDSDESSESEPEIVTGIDKLTEKVKIVRDKLGEVVFGQENAINIFTLGYFQAEMRGAIDATSHRPAATFLFAGSPGVGKTFLAKTAAGVLKLPCKEFDMSEYADPQSFTSLIGNNKVYRGSQEGELTKFVKENPKCVLIFDEIEKAHATTIHLFLQLLDAGRLKDAHSDEFVNFNRAIIIFTTNAGKQLYNSSESGDFSGVSGKVILNALQKDINPFTMQPYFPAAICSRFASGNVVMFNNMNANSLCDIARAEANRFLKNFAEKYNISFAIDDTVYSALLFAEGGYADARTLRARTEKFFNDEIFELFRLISAEGKEDRLKQMESIKIDIALPENEEIAKYFTGDANDRVILFSANPKMGCDSTENENIAIETLHNKDEFEKMLKTKSVSFVVIDFDAVVRNGKKYLNIEDVSSEARDVFRYLCEKYPELPIYILHRKNHELNIEEQKSFLNNGVRGFIEYSEDDKLSAEKITELCKLLHHQKSMTELAKSNLLITFETGQTVSKDGKNAQITLFDFKSTTAVDAEDTGNIMSSVSKPNVKFDDVIGAKDAKEELRFFIDYLKNPKEYTEKGLRAPKGVLLYGPPGTGKTLLAKATASEAGVTFISAEGNQFIKKYVGEGKDALHDLFDVARKYSPTVLFIDEFEAIAKERQGGDQAAANGEDVLTALLTEMDGFNTDPTRPVFVLAATNFDIAPGTPRSLDRALLRRFDSHIFVDLPDKSERLQFINKKIAENPIFDISAEERDNIAVRSTGMSLSILDSVFELSLRIAIRTEEHKVTDKVLDEAFEKYNSGEEKKWDSSLVRRVAYHEAGHAFVCWRNGETPSYLTIVARGSHGGYMQHNDNEGKALYTRQELYSRIQTSLGGRASEIVFYGEKDGISTGASGDLASATMLARQIICKYGMDDVFGLSVIDLNNATGETEIAIRAQVNKILNEQMQAAIQTITDGKEAIEAIVEELMSRNHLKQDEIDGIFSRYYTAK